MEPVNDLTSLVFKREKRKLSKTMNCWNSKKKLWKAQELKSFKVNFILFSCNNFFFIFRLKTIYNLEKTRKGRRCAENRGLNSGHYFLLWTWNFIQNWDGKYDYCKVDNSSLILWPWNVMSVVCMYEWCDLNIYPCLRKTEKDGLLSLNHVFSKSLRQSKINCFERDYFFN